MPLPPLRIALTGPWQLALLAALPLAALAALQALPVLPPLLPLLALAAACGVLTAWLRGLRRWRFALLLLSLLPLALAWGSWRATQQLEPALHPAWEGRPLRFEAEVLALPQAQTGHGGRLLWRLHLRPLGAAHDADLAAGADTDAPARVMLPEGLSLWFETEQVPRAGERWRFEARLKRVHALQNPGLPDAELWLLERGIRAQGTVLRAHKLADAAPWSLQAQRQALRDRLLPWLPIERERAVVAGLLIGDQAALSSPDWALLRDTGVVHLFSISGLHITAFAWLAAWALRGVWRRWPRLALWLPAAHAARWGGLLAATGYALLAGFGVPAQRTVALLLVLAVLQSSGRLWPWPLALLLCALPIGLADPWALVQPGFWLSFVAVGLLMQQGSSAQPSGWWRELLRTQAVVTLGLAPLLVLFFGQVSVVGVLANLLAVPLVTLLLTPLCLLGLLLPWAWWLCAWLVQLLFWGLQQLAGLPWAVWSLPEAPLALQLLALAGLLLAALRLPRWLRGLGGLLLLPLFLWQPARPPEGQFQLRVFDVGQGSAVWLRTARHDLLYDTGPRWGPGGGQDAGARILLPSLRAAGVRRLDELIVSHGDADHSGGLASLLAAMPVGVLRAPPDPRLGGAQGQPCAAGLAWRWDGVHFKLLHPAANSPPRAGNANGCVLEVRAREGAGRSVLLTADIEAAQEAQLVESGGLSPVDLLLLPHHGSQSSSSPAFLAAVAPQLAFAQAGYRNRHGHPALAVQTRLRELGHPLLTSSQCGALDWDSRQPPSAAGCWRVQRARYWHGPPPSLNALEALDGPALPE